MNQIKLVFNMTWLMETLKIQLEEQPLIKCCIVKPLILLKIQNMMNMKGVLLQLFMNILIEKLVLCMQINS